MNIFDYAIQMELDGKNFYEKLAEEANDKGLKAIFSWLADDERKHHELFTQLKERTEVSSMTDSKALSGAKNIFIDLQQREITLAADASNLEAYKYAMQIENDSAELYQQAAAKETEPKVKKILLRIAKEERQHLNIIENIFEFVNAPNQALVWGEFSNLEEF